MTGLIAVLVLHANITAIVVAAVRGINYELRERAFWRAYDEKVRLKGSGTGPCLSGHCR